MTNRSKLPGVGADSAIAMLVVMREGRSQLVRFEPVPFSGTRGPS